MTPEIGKRTLEEYHRMIESGVFDGRRVELLRGEIVEMPPEGEPHAYFSTKVENYLAQQLGERALIRPAKPITLPNSSEPEPDVAIVQPLDREYLAHHPYPQNIFWLIECSDASLSKDLNVKSQVYAEAEIAEYWVMNLKTRSLSVFRSPKSGEYTSLATYTEGQLAPLAFPDISLSIRSMINRS